MTKYAVMLLILTTATTAPAFAQHDQRGQHEQRDAHANNRPRANAGHLPPTPARRPSNVRPEPEHVGGNYVNSLPHVSHDRWYGHDSPTYPRYHLDHPFRGGRFARVGPAYRYSISRLDPGAHRFWVPGGYYFDIAPWEWPLVADWCWDCGDDFVIYIDADHPGWYLLYNVHTGTYVHVQYIGV